MKSVRTVANILASTESAVYSIVPLANLYEAIELMDRQQIGALPVIQDGKVIGIISERDFVHKVILKGRALQQTRVSEIMIRDVIKVAPQDHIEQCMEKMRDHHFRRLVARPVSYSNRPTRRRHGAVW